MSGAKQKLTIRQWNTKAGSEGAVVFTAMLNPASYSRSRSLQYTDDQEPKDAPAKDRKLKNSPAEKLDLEELVIDGTGIVDAPAGTLDVDGQIDLLTRVLSEPGSDQMVRQAVVEIVWGSLSFIGRLTTMNVKYTLFSPSGTPLRARVKLAFVAYEPPPAAAGSPAAAAPARQVRVSGGDSLPLLCFKAYNDASLFQAVALLNGLTTLRGLPAGLLLTLPKMG